MPRGARPAEGAGGKAPAALAARIRRLRREVEALRAAADDFPALARNCERILASLRMLALHIEDPVAFGVVDGRPPRPRGTPRSGAGGRRRPSTR